MRKGWAAVPLATALLSACPDFGNLSGGAASADAGNTSDGACGASQKACVGKCVEQSDPDVGCSGECSACSAAPNAQAGCVLQNNAEVCGIGTCNPQYGNCDDQAENGCETHTTTSTNCGACGVDCGSLYCVLQGAIYGCSVTCDPPNKLCPKPNDGGLDCANLPTDIANCGNCGVNCAVANGSGTCASGTCVITCDTNYFRCGNACILPSNTQCGSGCAACGTGTVCDVSVGSQTYGTCISTGSGSNCDGGVDLTKDPNCGACGVDCSAIGRRCCKVSTADGGSLLTCGSMTDLNCK
jgi:hypothetical protein